MRRTRALLFGVLLALVPAAPVAAAPAQIKATLDGRPIKISEIPDYDCHDLEFPVIRCFATQADRDASLSVEAGSLEALAAAAVAYVTMYDGASFTGATFTASQNYDALVSIGWNDRVSSFRARNSETGVFYVDWFAGGSSWSFCCNGQASSLGSFNNTFSSVYRT